MSGGARPITRCSQHNPERACAGPNQHYIIEPLSLMPGTPKAADVVGESGPHLHL